MEKFIKDILSIFIIFLISVSSGFGQQSASYAKARDLYINAAAKTKCPDRARVFREYANWNDCMVKLLAGQASSCGNAPTTLIPECPGDLAGGGGTGGSQSNTNLNSSNSNYNRPGTSNYNPSINSSYSPSNAPVSEEDIRQTVEGIFELIEMTRRSPEQKAAAQQKYRLKHEKLYEEEREAYGSNKIGLSLEGSILAPELKSEGYTKFYTPEDNYDPGNSFGGGINIEFRPSDGSRGAMFHTGLGFKEYKDDVLVREPEAPAGQPDSLAILNMKYIRIPAIYSIRLFRLFSSATNGVYLQFGFNGNFLLNACTIPGKTLEGSLTGKQLVSVTKRNQVTDYFKRISANGFVGIRFDVFNRLYFQAHWDIPLYPDSLLKSEYLASEWNTFKRVFGASAGMGIYLKK